MCSKLVLLTKNCAEILVQQMWWRWWWWSRLVSSTI